MNKYNDFHVQLSEFVAVQSRMKAYIILGKNRKYIHNISSRVTINPNLTRNQLIFVWGMLETPSSPNQASVNHNNNHYGEHIKTMFL